LFLRLCTIYQCIVVKYIANPQHIYLTSHARSRAVSIVDSWIIALTAVGSLLEHAISSRDFLQAARTPFQNSSSGDISGSSGSSGSGLFPVPATLSVLVGADWGVYALLPCPTDAQLLALTSAGDRFLGTLLGVLGEVGANSRLSSLSAMFGGLRFRPEVRMVARLLHAFIMLFQIQAQTTTGAGAGGPAFMWELRPSAEPGRDRLVQAALKEVEAVVAMFAGELGHDAAGRPRGPAVVRLCHTLMDATSPSWVPLARANFFLTSLLVATGLADI
jgi:hypothetical protein